MPTQTFFNLPEDKRSRIIEAAIAEFADNPFGNASIARIVETAGIPRGSFYQYFDGIMDLYKYIFQLTGERKIQYMHGVIANLERLPFFELMRELYAAGFRFAGEHPGLAAVGNRFFQEDRAFRQEIFAEMEDMSRGFYQHVLALGRDRGEIDPGINIEVASFMMFVLNVALVDHFLEQSTVRDVFGNVDGFIAMADQMLHILESGMGAERTGAGCEGVKPSDGEEQSCSR